MMGLLRFSLCLLAATAGFALRSSSAEPSLRSLSSQVDSQIESVLQAQQLKPAARASDGELVRRLYLDILGRIPTPAEVDAFAEEKSAEKHHQLIDNLLAHEEMPAYWRSVFDEWLNGNALERDFGRDGFLDFMQEALATNRPWNEIARQLLAPNVNEDRERAAAYFLALRLRSGDNAEKLDNLTSAVATGLFGLQLQCAKCHDHPFVDELKQDHYYGLSAFLSRTQDARMKDTPIIREKAEGEVSFINKAKEEKSARLMFLDNHLITEPTRPPDKNAWYTKGENGLPDAPYFSRRAALADYALQPDSAFFKRALVNRIWKQLLGRGLVEPVDQMHAANPASHPAVLDLLADDFAKNGFNIRRLMAVILHSEAYLRSSRWEQSGAHPRNNTYAVALLKPLSPEQLVTSVGIATGHYEQLRLKHSREQKGPPSTAPPLALARTRFLRDREVQEFAQRFRNQSDSFEASAAQALFLSYHPLPSKQLLPGLGNLVERMTKLKSDDEVVSEAYRWVLSRNPTPDELQSGGHFLVQMGSNRKEACRDLAWSLLCSAEFRFNF